DVIVLVGTGEAKHSEGPIGLGNTGLISVRPIPAPRTRVDETKPIVVEGSHGPDLIHRIIRTHRIKLGSCLKLGAAEPARKEQVPIRFVIAADGRVPTATVEPSSPAAGGFPSPATARR